MEVYARDHGADEMFGEENNWTYVTNYKAKLKNGELDLEDLIKNMINLGWLNDFEKPEDFKVREYETNYFIYDEYEAVFEVRK